MEPETELISKYDHILTTMRTQIRNLKASLKETEVKRQRRTDEATEFKEELVRKEFELEECVLELEEVKSALRNTQKTVTMTANPAPVLPLNWEDLPVKDDLGKTDEISPETELLLQKVDLAERENQVLRDKVDLKDAEIRAIMTKSIKPDLRLTRTYQEDKSSKREKTASEYEREIATLRAKLEEKERELRSPREYVPRLSIEQRPSISALREEVKQQLERDVATPSRLHEKIESLHDSMVAYNPSGLITEKEAALVQLQGRFENLAEQYRSAVQAEPSIPPSNPEIAKIKAEIEAKETAISDFAEKISKLKQEIANMQAKRTEERKREGELNAELTALREELTEKDQVLGELQDQYVELSDQCQALMEARVQQARYDESSAYEPTPDPIILSQSSTPNPPEAISTPKVARSPVPPKPGAKPAINILKEGVRKIGAAAKVVNAMKGKVGAVRGK